MSSSSSSPHEIILTSSPDGPIIAYDASSGATVTHFAASRSPRRGLALVGKAFIAASHICPITASGSIHLYNWWSSTAFHKLPVPEPVAPLTATPDGSYLFAGGLSGTLYALSLPSGDTLCSLPTHNKPVSCLTISEDGSLLISGSDDGTIVVIPIFQFVGLAQNDGTDHPILHKFAAHLGSVTAIASGTGLCNCQIISCSVDSTCKFWSLLRGTHLGTVVFPCAILGIALNPPDMEFYAGGSDGSVYKATVKIGSRKLVAQGTEEVVRWGPNDNNGAAIVALAMVNDGRDLASASEDGNVRLWKSDEGVAILGIRNEMGIGISDLVVARGIGHGGKEFGVLGLRDDELRGEFYGGEALSCFPVKETMEMEDVMAEAEKDRSRAIDMLESAIAMYEKLLELILKEAKGASAAAGDGSCSREVMKEKDDTKM